MFVTLYGLLRFWAKKLLIFPDIEQKISISPINSFLQCENTKKNYYNRKKNCKFAEKFKNSYKIRHGR